MKAYQLKLTIKGSHPPIWRRIIVPSGYSFSQFSIILYTAMGWSGYHLSMHEFPTLGLSFAEESEDDDLWGEPKDLNAALYVIDEFLEQVKSYTYTYDFGDDWEHKVEVEKILDNYDKNCPTVIKMKGETPPEDCGGIWGYEKLQETLKNPKDPEYKDLNSWVDGHWQVPYDMEEVNEVLADMYLTNRKAKPKTEVELAEALGRGKKGFSRITPAKLPDPKEDNSWSGFRFGDAVVKGGYIDHLQQMIEEERSKMTDAKTAVCELTLLLMYLTRFTEDEDFDTAKEFCAWKGYDFSAMDELEDAEYIQKRSRGAKSVWITEQGVEQAKMLMLRYGVLDWEKKETKK